MASDSFTDSDGTALASHTAGGVTWALASGSANTTINSNMLDIALWTRNWWRSDSTEDRSLITYKGGIGVNNLVKASIRTPTSGKGYDAFFSANSGGNWTTCQISEGGAWRASGTVSYATASDHVLEIVGTEDGSDLTLDVYVDGTRAKTWTDTTPTAAGYSGFALDNDTGTARYGCADDWSDGAASGVEGSAAITLGALTVAGEADVAVTGSAAITLAALTAAGEADVAVTGALARSLDAALAAGEADVAVAGWAAATLDGLTVAGTCAVELAGSLAATLGPLTLVAAGRGPSGGRLLGIRRRAVV